MQTRVGQVRLSLVLLLCFSGCVLVPLCVSGLVTGFVNVPFSVSCSGTVYHLLVSVPVPLFVSGLSLLISCVPVDLLKCLSLVPSSLRPYERVAVVRSTCWELIPAYIECVFIFGAFSSSNWCHSLSPSLSHADSLFFSHSNCAPLTLARSCCDYSCADCNHSDRGCDHSDCSCNHADCGCDDFHCACEHSHLVCLQSHCAHSNSACLQIHHQKMQTICPYLPLATSSKQRTPAGLHSQCATAVQSMQCSSKHWSRMNWLRAGCVC